MGVEIGQTISHYKILRKLGHGGMGDVYLAENTRLGLKVALKFLAAELTRDPSAIKRLEHEARAVAELSHNNISRINDIKEADGHHFLVLEYLEGETLSDLIQRGPLPIEETVRIGKALAEGLAHAHGHGIVHRDMKASNVMLTSDGGVKIMDFGLARMADATRLTEPGTTLGTVSHMSPEQASGKEADERSDLWSLGVVLYQCLTGRLPFEGESAPVVLNRIGTASPTPPTSLRTGVPMDLDRIVLRCLEKDSTLRFQHADDLLSELRLSESASRMPTSDASTLAISSPLRQTSGASRRWGALIVISVVIVLAAIWRPWESSEPEDPADQATTETVPERPNWILVADFEGPAGEPQLATAVRELTVAALSYSKVVTPLTRQQMARGLRMAMKPDSTRVTSEVARELAIRASARTFLEGRIDRIMMGFSIVLSVMDAENGAMVMSVQGSAENEEALIPTLDQLGRDLREQLGDKTALLKAERLLPEVITPSWEAYVKYLQAVQLTRARDNETSVQLLREAIVLDLDFASAWRLMGTNYFNLGRADSARTVLARAHARPERLTDEEHLHVRAHMAIGRGDLLEALKAYDLLVRINPNLPEVHANRGVVLVWLGRAEEAYDAYVQAEVSNPFGPSQSILSKQFSVLLRMGRIDEARQVLKKVTGEARGYHLDLAVASHDWPEIRTFATALSDDPTVTRRSQRWATEALVCAQAAQGEIHAVSSRLALLANKDQGWACTVQTSLILASGVMPDSAEFNTCADIGKPGRWAAVRGDTATARQALVKSRDIAPQDSRGRNLRLDLLEACIAAVDEEWAVVLRILDAVNTDPRHNSIPEIRWLIAEAHQHLGHPEEAIEHYLNVISPVGLDVRALYRSMLFAPFAHHRLVMLYSKMGRVEDARRHWEIFEKTFTNPDPELLPMIEEGRQALEEAEAKAAS